MVVEKFYSSKQDERFDPYLKAIGIVAVTWAEFEHAVNDGIWELANVSRQCGTCLTSQFIGPGPRFRCLVSLLGIRKCPEAIIKGFNSISGAADKLGRQRNRYLHDPIVVDSDAGTIMRMESTADRQVKHDFMPVEVKEMETLADEIDELTGRFDTLFEQMLKETPAWPREQFLRSEGIRRYRKAPDSSETKP